MRVSEGRRTKELQASERCVQNARINQETRPRVLGVRVIVRIKRGHETLNVSEGIHQECARNSLKHVLNAERFMRHGPAPEETRLVPKPASKPTRGMNRDA